MTAPHYVRSSDGTRIAVYRHARRDRPVIVAVHGYPDNHAVWDGVVAALGERFDVVTYDVRGAGASDKPTRRPAYRIERLTDDLLAVLDEVSPSRPAHLLGHDWGSIQLWTAVGDPRLAGHVASYTSCSGACLDYVPSWVASGRRRDVLKQLAESYYMALFQLPWLPETAWRLGFADRRLQAARRIGTPVGVRPEERSAADKLNGVNLYRANTFQRLARPAPVAIDVPVQVIAPRDDRFVTVAVQTQAPRRWVRDLTVHEVDGGHWAIADRAEEIARLVDEFVDRVERGAELSNAGLSNTGLTNAGLTNAGTD